MKVRHVFSAIVALALTASVSPAQMQGMMHGKSGEKSPMSEEMKERCEKLMAERKAMHEEMAAKNRKLDELVGEMKAAEGDEKVDAVAAVVEELVSQRRQRHDRMAGMRTRMMGRMHSGMGMGMMEGCPMMEEDAPAGGESDAEDHEAHHPGKE